MRRRAVSREGGKKQERRGERGEGEREADGDRRAGFSDPSNAYKNGRQRRTTRRAAVASWVQKRERGREG